MKYFSICTLSIPFVLFIGSCTNSNPSYDPDKELNVNDLIKKTDSLEWQVYGLPDFEDFQRYQLAKTWGFKYEVVAGCIVSDSLAKAVEENNKKSDSLLSISFGKDWREKFERAADSLYKLDSISKIHK